MSDDNIDTGAPENGSTGGSALKALVSFFTIWHMDIDQGDMDAMERNFGLVPIVGLLFGAVIIVAMTILDYINISQGYGSGILFAVVVLAIVYAGSKFIHFDGLTDFGDGMIVSGQQVHPLRRSDRLR